MGDNAAEQARKAQQAKTVGLTGNLVNSYFGGSGGTPLNPGGVPGGGSLVPVTPGTDPSINPFPSSPINNASPGANNPLTKQITDFNTNLVGNYNDAVTQNKADYSSIMQGYKSINPNVNWTPVSYNRPAELTTAFGNLESAGKGYQDFANTGGYSPTDIQELRARGMSPIRSAYGNTMMQLDRARSLGGNGGAANYIAATSKAQRELPGQLADAQTTVNAGLADAIRQGKLSGLAGLAGVGGTEGGLSSDEAARILSAQLANSQGEMAARNSTINNQFGQLSGQAGLYGTTPGMSSMFGNQALQGMGLANSNQANNQNYGLGLIDENLRALNPNLNQNTNTPWWHTALAVAGAAAPYIAMAASDKNLKKDIHTIDEDKVREGIKKLNLSTWKYKGEDTTHMGPMAQDVKKYLGIGDGKTIHLADIMGVMLATAKADSRVGA